MEVTGEVGINEGQKACAPLRKHLFGAKRFMPWVFLLSYLAALVGVVTLFDRFAPRWSLVGILVLAAAAYALWIRYCRRMGPKAWMERGVPPLTTVSFRLEGERLVIVGPNSETRLHWSAVSQITRDKTYWLFIGPGLAYFLPVRFFTDREAEQAFLDACLERLTPEARARTGQIKLA